MQPDTTQHNNKLSDNNRQSWQPEIRITIANTAERQQQHAHLSVVELETTPLRAMKKGNMAGTNHTTKSAHINIQYRTTCFTIIRQFERADRNSWKVQVCTILTCLFVSAVGVVAQRRRSLMRMPNGSTPPLSFRSDVLGSAAWRWNRQILHQRQLRVRLPLSVISGI